MEAEVITSFLPDLVKVVSGCVQSVSDQCLAKGLIPESVYRRVLELGVTTSEDKARTLLQAVKNGIETDERCFETFLNILEQELPFASRDNLLKGIRREAKEAASACRAVVPLSQNIQQTPREELPRECAIQQRSLLGKLEEAIRRHQCACDEKKHSEEKLNVKIEECEVLKRALETQTQNSTTELDDAKSKITACESEIDNLKAKVKELESIIEEQDMQARRGRNDMIMQTGKMFTVVAQESHAAGQEKAKEEMRDREHELKMQEKDIKIQKLEEESKQQKESSDTTDLVPEDALTPKHIRNLKKYLEHSQADRRERRDHWEQSNAAADRPTREYYYEIAQQPPTQGTCPDYPDEGRRGRQDYNTDWHRNLALHLGFTEEEYRYELDTSNRRCTCNPIYRRFFGHKAQCRLGHECIGDEIYDIIEQWVRCYPGDSRGTTSFPTYSRLKRALLDQGFGDIVRELPKDISGLSEEVQRP